MGSLYLPCESYHREFDSKLLLAMFSFREYGHESFIGYDKYFGGILKTGQPGLLLDKSCSSIMWNARIKHAIANGGNAIVNDEEGFFHINKEHARGWSSRVDKIAASKISEYIAWGSIDHSFFSKNIKELQNKISIIGNCRSDLVTEIGKNSTVKP